VKYTIIDETLSQFLYVESLRSECNCEFVRFFGQLKKKIKQQACPKGSITEANLEAERIFFALYYFSPNVPSMRARCRRNEDGDDHINHFSTLSVFEPQGTAIGGERSIYLTDAEYVTAYLHVLLNCDEVKPYIG